MSKFESAQCFLLFPGLFCNALIPMLATILLTISTWQFDQSCSGLHTTNMPLNPKRKRKPVRSWMLLIDSLPTPKLRNKSWKFYGTCGCSLAGLWVSKRKLKRNKTFWTIWSGGRAPSRNLQLCSKHTRLNPPGMWRLIPLSLTQRWTPKYGSATEPEECDNRAVCIIRTLVSCGCITHDSNQWPNQARYSSCW